MGCQPEQKTASRAPAIDGQRWVQTCLVMDGLVDCKQFGVSNKKAKRGDGSWVEDGRDRSTYLCDN
jgi:hypothetical protein